MKDRCQCEIDDPGALEHRPGCPRLRSAEARTQEQDMADLTQSVLWGLLVHGRWLVGGHAITIEKTPGERSTRWKRPDGVIRVARLSEIMATISDLAMLLRYEPTTSPPTRPGRYRMVCGRITSEVVVLPAIGRGANKLDVVLNPESGLHFALEDVYATSWTYLGES